jgi:uncharacterized protein YbaP (TraB family)
MRHLFQLAAALLAMLGAPLAAQTQSQGAAAVPVAPPPAITSVGRPALWKLSDEDTTIYLFGTIHALPRGIDWFNGPVVSAFDASHELVTEIVPEEPAQMQKIVLDKAVLPKGQTLRGLMSAKDKAAYEAALGDLGLPPAVFDAFEPWYAAVGLSMLPLMREGYDRANGVEDALDARAKAAKRPHLALETAEQQLSLFDSLPMPVQQNYLGEVVDQLPQIGAKLGMMVEAWKTGDAAALARLMNDEADDPVLLKTLLIDRNRAWASWIDRRMDKPGIVFIAVGAGHLAGPGSVQDQLAALGLTTQRLQ